MNSRPGPRRFSNVSLAGVAVFGALSVILTYFSQFLGLNFPVVPYLQFDLGEVAILLSLFIFGPATALLSSFVEFVTLLAIGQNVPVGPVIKLFALVSSVAGIWLGLRIASKFKRTGMNSYFGFGTVFGTFVRALVTTLPNFYVLVFFYTIPVIVGFLSSSFKLLGVTLTEANALALVLGFTALFNVLQFVFVMVVTYAILKVPQVNTLKVAGRPLWFRGVITLDHLTQPGAEGVA